MVSILHISDLHRDSGSQLTTATLLESLRLDRCRYLQDGLQSPDLAVVSGDIVYGVKSDEAGGDAEISRQYEQANDFLVKLAELFFNGNRERIILVPGNHDISHPHVLRATAPERLPPEGEMREIVAKQLLADGSIWRWVWSDFSLRRIVDPDLYRNRLKPFADFYRAFYEHRRTFSLNPKEQFSVHDFPELALTFVGLSSCYDNDLYNRCGRIHPDCIAGATQAVADLVRAGRLPIAVWHHNLTGAPWVSDYVNDAFLQSLMDGGFLMGLHGHQHRPQFLQHRFTADQKKGLAVISAGTLCGGPRSLPSGRMRAYNLISIDIRSFSASLHVRGMTNDDFSLPVWAAAFVPEFGGHTMKFMLQSNRASPSSIQIVSEAADLLRHGDPNGALRLVIDLPHDEFGRRVAVQAFLELADWPGIIQFCNPPQSNAEIVALCEALYELSDLPALRKLIESDAIARSVDPVVRQCIAQARARLGGRL